MRLYLLFSILVLSVVCHSQERKYFTRFKPSEYVYGIQTFGCGWGKPTDSLKIELNILQTKVVNGMECTSFELKHKGDKAVFWIGIKDSMMYTFERNKLKKPVKMFNFKHDIGELKSIPFFPFAKENEVAESFTIEGDKFFRIYDSRFKGLMLGGLKFYFFYISLKRGLFFEVTSPDHELTYSNLDEI
ncbi:hypothetical protein LRS05_04200 [Flavobacterium sp. J372]|uniref:hypothetical protein n=1 Tax=Flavobacterium sp. J372 TaxID=2898436 RepID=UPI002150D0AF|nr:hypothetical protein [Flavobacterium sp. J372]MCR5861399.1 hypothetical protein [Flavobacterium sp. J372]